MLHWLSTITRGWIPAPPVTPPDPPVDPAPVEPPPGRRLYSPSELGQLLVPPRSGRAVNKMLVTAGMQIDLGGRWLPTPLASKLFVLTDAGSKRNKYGEIIPRIRWYRGVLKALREAT